MKKQGFIKGAAIMAAASLVCKILSAVFKIPLDRFFLHEDGIAVFQSASSVYNVFLAICVTGIPIALSSLVARADDEETATLCKSTLYTVTSFCAVFAVIIFVFANEIATLLSGGGHAPAAYALRVSALALPFLGMISAGRGFFQGKSNMLPSALSQISESFIKAVLGTVVCAFLIKKGIESGAAGAMAGVCLGAISAAIILFIYYRKYIPRGGKFSKKAAISVIKLSLPVTLGAFGYTAVVLIDSLSVTSLLALSGADAAERLKLFGYLSRANTVYNLPATIITAVTLSAVPSVAAAIKNKGGLSESVQKSVKMILLVSFPCAFGLMFFSKPILSLLYASANHYELLSLTGLLVIIMPYVQATTAMLQAALKVWKPIVATFVSIMVKVILNFLLIPEIGVDGAPIATAVSFLIALGINTFLFRKELLQRKFIFTIVKVMLCALAACAFAKGIYLFKETPIILMMSIGVAAVVYFILIYASRSVSKEELLQLKGGV